MPAQVIGEKPRSRIDGESVLSFACGGPAHSVLVFSMQPERRTEQVSSSAVMIQYEEGEAFITATVRVCSFMFEAVMK